MIWSREMMVAWAKIVETQMLRGRQLGAWFESAGFAEGVVWLPEYPCALPSLPSGPRKSK